MKRLAVSLLIGLLLASTIVAAAFENCSCTANDGSCSASISCAGGCIAICPSGACRATCSGGGGEAPPDFEMQVSMQQAGNSRQLSSELARITGQPVVFTPFRVDETINLDVKRAKLWDLLEMLSASGKIEIAGDDFVKLQSIRKALVTGEKISVCIHNTTIQRIVSEFMSLSGLPIRTKSGDHKTVVSLSVKDVTLEEVLAQLSRQSGVEISVR